MAKAWQQDDSLCNLSQTDDISVYFCHVVLEFVLVIIAIRWPCDSCEYCPVRFISQLIDIISIK